MQRSILEDAARRFAAEEHIRDVLSGAWVDLHDETGAALPGIRGRAGACGMTVEGHEIGADLIEMDPGAAFALHVHPGDHLLFVVSGSLLVHVDGVDHPACTGHTIFIPADLPHGVKTVPGYSHPSRFLAVGVPHKHVSAEDRMTLVVADGRATPGDDDRDIEGDHVRTDAY